MATYVTLYNFTDQALRNIKDFSQESRGGQASGGTGWVDG